MKKNNNMEKNNKIIYAQNYTTILLIAVLFLLVIFTAIMLFQTKDYVGQAFQQYEKETKFSPEDTSRFTAEYKEKIYESKKKSQSKKLAASKPGSSNGQIAWYSEEDYASCKVKQNCVDKFDEDKDETKQGTILYYDPKKQECYTATDGCKDNNYLIEYYCDDYLASKQKINLKIFEPINCEYGCNAMQGKCNTKTEQQYGNCKDGIKNQDEQGVDCGGICPLKCATCTDFKLNQNEEFIDCGGICPACDKQKIKHCTNKIKDADETGLDCGGLICGPCKDKINTLYPNQCKNEFKEDNEETVDCGGPCPPCKYKDEINKQPDESIPEHCNNKLFEPAVEEKKDCGKECPACKQASCVDNIKNQGETGIDCGGSCPLLCSEKQDCSFDSDMDALGDGNQKKGINFAVPGHIISQGKTIFDSCNGNILKEKYCTIEGEATEFKSCSDGCIETENGALCDKKTCSDSDSYAPIITVEDSVFGVDLYSYDTKYSIPGSAEQKNTQGVITAGPLLDECVDADTVNEAYCSGNIPAYKQFDCPAELYGYDIFDGCANGICCSNDVKCIDGDIDTNAGKNLFKKAITQSPKICLSNNPSIYKTDSCGITYCLPGGTDGSLIDGKDNGYNCKNIFGKKIENAESDYGDLVKEYYCDGTTIQSQWFSCPQGQACLQGECTVFKCADTDKNEAKPELVMGYVTGIGFENNLPKLKTFNDVCIEGELLKEYKCGTRNLDYADQKAELISKDIYAVYDLVTCTGKCNAGKCVPDTAIIQPDPFVKCIDSDGANYYNKGTLEIIHQANPPKKDVFVDECLKSENTILKEWTCNINAKKPIYKKCELGCWDGKCL